MSLKAKRHMAKVAAIPCVVCEQMGLGETKAEVHHIGDTAERSDWLTVPLCPEHHRGPSGFHGLGGERPFFDRYKLTEANLLAMTLERLA